MTEDFGTRREWVRYHVGWNLHMTFVLPALILLDRLHKVVDHIDNRIVDWAERP